MIADRGEQVEPVAAMQSEAHGDEGFPGAGCLGSQQRGAIRRGEAGGALAEQGEQAVRRRIHAAGLQRQGDGMRDRGQAVRIGAGPDRDLGAEPFPVGAQAGEGGLARGSAGGQADRQGDAAERLQETRQVGVGWLDRVGDFQEQGSGVGVRQRFDPVA